MSLSSFFSVKNKVSKASVITGGINIDEQLRDNIQAALLAMYLDIYRVCNDYGISLYLCGGSAIGAVRHKGFIPWDDDMDTAISRADYEKFKQIFGAELSDKYSLIAPDASEGSRSRFPRVMKKNTVFREVGNQEPKERCGLCLDIFIIENTPNQLVLRKIKGSFCNILEFIGGQVLLVRENNQEVLAAYRSAGKVQYAIRMIVGRCFSFRSAADWNRTIDHFSKYNNDESKYCSIPTGRGHYFGEMLPREVFFPGKEGTFEGHDVLLFQDVDRYLTNLYGDYMKIPKKENREAHVVEEIWLGE